jgi:hypothetical protein
MAQSQIITQYIIIHTLVQFITSVHLTLVNDTGKWRRVKS